MNLVADSCVFTRPSPRPKEQDAELLLAKVYLVNLKQAKIYLPRRGRPGSVCTQKGLKYV